MAGEGTIRVVILIVPHRAKKLVVSLKRMQYRLPGTVKSGKMLYADDVGVCVVCMVLKLPGTHAAAAVTLFKARAPR